MKLSSEYVDSLEVGEKKIRIGSKVRILERTGWTEKELTYPFEGVISKIVEEWDNNEPGPYTEDYGPTFVTFEDGNSFYPGSDLQKIEIIKY